MNQYFLNHKIFTVIKPDKHIKKQALKQPHEFHSQNTQEIHRNHKHTKENEEEKKRESNTQDTR